MKRRDFIKNGLVVIPVSAFGGAIAQTVFFNSENEWCVEWQRLYNSLETKPTIEFSNIVNTYIQNLKSAGIWDKLNVLWMDDGITENKNWINPCQEIT